MTITRDRAIEILNMDYNEALAICAQEMNKEQFKNEYEAYDFVDELDDLLWPLVDKADDELDAQEIVMRVCSGLKCAIPMMF